MCLEYGCGIVRVYGFGITEKYLIMRFSFFRLFTSAYFWNAMNYSERTHTRAQTIDQKQKTTEHKHTHETPKPYS